HAEVSQVSHPVVEIPVEPEGEGIGVIVMAVQQIHVLLLSLDPVVAEGELPGSPAGPHPAGSLRAEQWLAAPGGSVFHGSSAEHVAGLQITSLGDDSRQGYEPLLQVATRQRHCAW